MLENLRARKHLEEIRSINIDNQGATALARNPEYHARTKHIDIQYHLVRVHIEKQAITLTYCATGEMTAYIFTKALPQPLFIKHNLNLGLVDYSANILQETSRTDRAISRDSLDDERKQTLGRSPSEQSPSEGWYG